MLRLIIDRQVLEALKVAVPKKNKAKERLDKYVSNLEQAVNSQIFRTRPVNMLAKHHYWASLTAIQEQGGQIWSLNNIRTHKWLEDNGLQLVEQINKKQANNITGEIAIIKFTHLVKVEDDEDLVKLQSMTDAQLDHHLQSIPQNDLPAYKRWLTDYLAASASQVLDGYDLLRVDVTSTISYIKKLVRSKVKNKDKTEYNKALRVLRVAQLNNGIYPQKKKLSDFGRTYYEGVSIQSVNKELRKAILKDCFEYDVKSSVVAWKLAFAPELLLNSKSKGTVESEFLAIYYYLIYKKDYFDLLQQKVFSNTEDLSDAAQAKMVKEAITALSFGGKLSGRWKNKFGEEQVSSVIQIFGNALEVECANFCNAVEITEFVRQQALLDKFIISKFTTQYPFLSNIPSLQTKSGRQSKSKVLAWLYQHAEAIVMTLVRYELKSFNVEIRANIHDAIVVDRRLTDTEIKLITQAIQSKTNLIYFALGETHYIS